MWRPWLMAIAAALGSVAGGAETLRVATYNVANYNLTDRMAEGVFRPDYPKPEAEKAALRQVIKALGADVLALQEMGGAEFLQELQRDLGRDGLEYPHAAILEHGDEPRYVAVLSRRPLLAQRGHRDLALRPPEAGETVRRGLLEVRVATAAGELTLFVVHLKSRFTERAEDPAAAQRRAAEAVALRDRILEVFPRPAEANFLVVGDFNAALGERPVRALLERGERAITQVVPVADDRGDRWTHHYRRDDSYTRVDHVLVSPRLAERVVEGRIHDGPGTRLASDHRPVVVTLQW